MKNNSELLLPVGNYQMCLAAIHNGADAIYVGMPGFNARGRSHDHEMEDLKEIIDTCHLYGVKVHMAFNILIFEDEFESAIKRLDEVMLLGPDAFIIQDIGLIKLIKERYPHMVIHGSTQMSITNHEAISLLEDLDIKRFVLGRENSIDEIEIVKANTDKELEVFVHGALCVAYSGQCFTSESLGGRSANRGQCAQSCRFNYELYVDDEKKDLVGKEYLVSPKDLCGIEEVPKLLQLGVESFKVEGRLKSPDFVGTVASSYRKVIDGNLSQLELDKSKMAVSYSRGFYKGWLNGVAHQELVDGVNKSHMGQYISKINHIRGSKIYFASNYNLELGDGLLVVNEKGEHIGGKIYHIKKLGDNLEVGFNKDFPIDKIAAKNKVYWNSSDQLTKEVKKSFTDKILKKRLPISITFNAKIGKNATLSFSDGTHHFELESSMPVEESVNKPLTQDDVLASLGGLSHSAFYIAEGNYNIDSGAFLHRKVLKELKQQMVEMLNHARVEFDYTAPKPLSNGYFKPKENNEHVSAKLNILVRNISQLETLVDKIQDFSSINYIILDYEFGKDYFSSVKLLKDRHIPVAIATTRILKPKEYHNFTLIERCEPDAILVRNLGALNYFKEKTFKLFSDFSLNVANSMTFDYLSQKGLDTLCLSYDLNINQLNHLLDNIDTSKAEITIHQYMPEFHMEHCVFAAFMSKGNSFRDCGKPCEKHEVYLKDMYGNRHEIKADQECRNTMFNAKAQSTIKYLNTWMEKGVGLYRFECLHEQGDELISKVQTYLNLFEKKISYEEAYKKLGQVESYGLGLGVLEKTTKYRDKKLL